MRTVDVSIAPNEHASTSLTTTNVDAIADVIAARAKTANDSGPFMKLCLPQRHAEQWSNVLADIGG
jgi:hypothetical protein